MDVTSDVTREFLPKPLIAMTRAIEIWAPWFELNPLEGPYAHDLRCAEAEREDEDRVWLIPGAQQVGSFTGRNGLSERVVRSETFNVIEIYNVTPDRKLFPHLPTSPPSIELPPRFYHHWIDTFPRHRDLPRELTVDTPVISSDKVDYVTKHLEVRPGGTTP